MRALVSAAALSLLISCAAQAQEPSPDLSRAEDFAPGSGRVWLSGCEFQADRYVVCKHAARTVLDAISNVSEGTPGEALQAFMRAKFLEKGCTFEAPAETFRVNGIFLSFDSQSLDKIQCEGQASKLVFAPGVISLLNILYFLSGDPPQER